MFVSYVLGRGKGNWRDSWWGYFWLCFCSRFFLFFFYSMCFLFLVFFLDRGGFIYMYKVGVGIVFLDFMFFWEKCGV